MGGKFVSKSKIYDRIDKATIFLEEMKQNIDQISLLEYKDLVQVYLDKNGNEIKIWSDAFDAALSEHKTVLIPASEEKYYISRSILLSSGNGIIAEEGATIRLLDGVRVLMLRNKNVVDGSFLPNDKESEPDRDIFVVGGRWEEYHEKRCGYLGSGRMDENEDWLGVSTAMLFSNVENLLIQDITCYHTAGFAIQIGNAKNFIVENITFEECFADGVHLNGNLYYGAVRNIKGYTKDDLVALNTYDWANSGINFGPLDYVVIENLYPSEDSPYKAVRIQPGTYFYEDGSSCDCSVNHLIVKNVHGVENFKLYLQLPAYEDTPVENATIGSGGAIYFENIEIDLKRPMDYKYVEKNKEGYKAFGAFEIGANIGSLFFENINVKVYRDINPECAPIVVGPMSATAELGRNMEIYMPDVSCVVDKIFLKNFCVNEEPIKDVDEAVKVVEMHLNEDYPNTFPRGGEAKGMVRNIVIM